MLQLIWQQEFQTTTKETENKYAEHLDSHFGTPIDILTNPYRRFTSENVRQHIVLSQELGWIFITPLIHTLYLDKRAEEGAAGPPSGRRARKRANLFREKDILLDTMTNVATHATTTEKKQHHDESKEKTIADKLKYYEICYCCFHGGRKRRRKMCQIADASVLHVQQNINDPMFTVIETYAVYHRRNEPIIRKVTS